jgi:hypothetical protein
LRHRCCRSEGCIIAQHPVVALVRDIEVVGRINRGSLRVIQRVRTGHAAEIRHVAGEAAELAEHESRNVAGGKLGLIAQHPMIAVIHDIDLGQAVNGNSSGVVEQAGAHTATVGDKIGLAKDLVGNEIQRCHRGIELNYPVIAGVRNIDVAGGIRRHTRR